MSALLALANAATTILSDEEGDDVSSSPQSDEASLSTPQEEKRPSDGSAVPTNRCEKAVDDTRPVKTLPVQPVVAQAQTLPNIIIPPPQAQHGLSLRDMVNALAVHQAQTQPTNIIRAQQPALYQPVQLQNEAPPMPLSILPKKKRKKKEQRYTDLQGQYLATSWYFNESTFPVTLMAIIESQDNSPCITFLSDNQRFVIVDPARLEQEIFPKHFDLRTPTLDEFSEMLNLWGFEKSVDKLFPNVAVYKHEQFKKGDWEKCLKIEMPLGSLEKLTKIQVESAKADGAQPKTQKENARKRPRRGNGVPLPPAELVDGFAPASKPDPLMNIPRRITQEKAPSLGGSNANAQSLLLSQLHLGQNHLQSMMLGQSFQQQQQNPFMGRRISVDTTNPFVQRFNYPQPSPSIPPKTNAVTAVNQNHGSDVLAPPVQTRKISNEPVTLNGKKLNSSQLDALTEQFLARSNARLKSRPAGIKGPLGGRRPSLPIGGASGVQPSQLELQSLLAARQRLGNTRRITML